MITYISPINMVAEDNQLYFAYKSPLVAILLSTNKQLMFERLITKTIYKYESYKPSTLFV